MLELISSPVLSAFLVALLWLFSFGLIYKRVPQKYRREYTIWGLVLLVPVFLLFLL